MRGNINTSRLKENILTCYFLDCYNGAWRFKDNNLLFFLIAEIYYEKLNLISKEYNDYSITNDDINGGNKYIISNTLYESLQIEKSIPLHPLSIEFLFQKINKITPEKKKIIWNFLFSLIENGFILQINEKNLQKLDIEKLNIDILLLLIFKHINTGNYEDINIIYFFKRYNWFISAAKIIDKKYLFFGAKVL